MGVIARLRMQYEGEAGPASVIAKFPSLANRAIGEATGVYERENLLLRRILGADARERAAAVLRRLRSGDVAGAPVIASGAGQLPADVDAAVGRSHCHLDSVAQEATLHPADRRPGGDHAGRTRWRGQRRSGAPTCSTPSRGCTPPSGMTRGSRGATGSRRSPATCAYGTASTCRPSPRSGSGPGRACPRISATSSRGLQSTALQSSRSSSRRLPPRSCTATLRLDNMAFRGDDPVLFDWQAVRHGPATYDVAYFLSGACPTPHVRTGARPPARVPQHPARAWRPRLLVRAVLAALRAEHARHRALARRPHHARHR